jgi:phosphosulfolactate phosphohydrolase-like enzyme
MRNLPALLGESVHGGRLLSLGFAPDMAYAAEIDASSSVLVLGKEMGLPCIVSGITPAP